MQLKDLESIRLFDKVMIHSLSPNLYQVSVIVDGREDFLMNEKGEFLTSHNKQELQNIFKDKVVRSMLLCQQSAYDEMVGQPVRSSTNRLEVPIGNMDML